MEIKIIFFDVPTTRASGTQQKICRLKIVNKKCNNRPNLHYSNNKLLVAYCDIIIICYSYTNRIITE